MSRDLPDVYEATLDAETEQALFSDLATLATVEVSVKAGPATRAHHDPSYSLEQARAALHAGTLRAVQLRYRHGGKIWIDTVLRIGTELKLIRTAQPRHDAHGRL